MNTADMDNDSQSRPPVDDEGGLSGHVSGPETQPSGSSLTDNAHSETTPAAQSHVRFSTDVEIRTADAAAPTLTSTAQNVAPTGTGRPGTPTLSINTNKTLRPGGDRSSSPRRVSPLSPESPGMLGQPPNPSPSPISPAGRARGYSLRRQLFFRNQHEMQTNGQAKLADSIETVDQEKTVPSTQLSKTSSETKGTEGIAAFLPNYSTWTSRAESKPQILLKTIGKTLKVAKNFILRLNELPASKDGRQIPIDAERKEKLNDERRNGHYIDNTIRSSRYTVWNFLPRQLFFQFTKLANFYFLCVSTLQMIPGLSTTGTFTTFAPLVFFISISIGKEGYDDYRRYKQDKIENRRVAEIFCVGKENVVSHDYDENETKRVRLKRWAKREKQPVADDDGSDAETGPDSASTSSPAWQKKKWRDVRVGDLIRLERDAWVPADILLLASSLPRDIAYVETAALDGESNLKSKQALPLLADELRTREGLISTKARVVCEDPNRDLYNFEGKVTYNGETKPISNNQILYRGSIIRNTDECVGVVIFTGEESKIRMNANKNPRTKAPQLQWMVNKVVAVTVVFVLALAIFNSVAYQIWRGRTEHHSWYLNEARIAFFPIFASALIMLNTMIPLSLYVSLEIIKLAQMILLNDIDMYDEESDTPMEARTSTINEELGQISYIFSDKTGTLTDNVMIFRKLSVAGVPWIHDVDLQRKAEVSANKIMLRHKKRRMSKKKLAQITTAAGDLASEPKIVQKQPVAVDHDRSGHPSGNGHGKFPRKSMASTLDRRDSGMSKWRSSARPGRSQIERSTIELIQYLQTNPHTLYARRARFFLLTVALCHTCLPERDEDDEITFQSSSPDELALVRAAKELGYIVVDRNVDTITIQTFPNGLSAEPVSEDYEILETIEFSSKRKRMSIVVRVPNGKILLLCKGADSTITELLAKSALAMRKAAEAERKENVRKSLEVQEMIRRNSTNRPSMGGPTRPSITLSKLRAIPDELDEFLRERERESRSYDEESIYSRPSAHYDVRHSMAYGEMRPSLDREQSADIIDERLLVNDEVMFERTFTQINEFASEGLRTLVYAYRYLDEAEFQSWKKIYSEASTSLVDRQQMIEAAAEIVEQQLELAGATAIEDKLQRGVPEAIDKLRRANIKLWMLTGDKRETAINIGHSCRLIKDYSTTTLLDKEDGDVDATMAAATLAITGNTVAHSVVIVDGATLTMIQDDATLKRLFFDLVVVADSVICCRASPSQKAGLVRTIRKKVKHAVTLAIGDGANDIAMIQEAHVGIGITGKEGLQAARSSDYSIAQFRFLLKLLLVHGRWNYIRTCKYALATFWKEMLFYLTQAIYQRYNGFTGTSLYEQWSLSMFNTLFTSLPVIFYGIFEKDLAASTLLSVPELYTKGQRSGAFNMKLYAGWMFMAASQSLLCFYIAWSLYGLAFVRDYTIYPLGTLTYTAIIIVISIKLQVLEMHNKSIMALISFVLSVGGWFLWTIAFSKIYKHNVIYVVRGGFTERFGRDAQWWLTLLLCISIPVLLDIIITAIRVGFFPTDVDTFQELEKMPEVRKRLEEGASEELQQGWQRGNKKSSFEIEQLAREGMVQELLDRPRVMEEGRTSFKDKALEKILRRPRPATLPPRRSSDESGAHVQTREEIERNLETRFGAVQSEGVR